MVQIFTASVMGFLTLHGLDYLPSYWYIIILIVLGVVIFCIWKNLFLLCFSLAIMWSVFDANQYVNHIKNIPSKRSNLTIDISISTLFNENMRNTYFEAQVINLDASTVGFIHPVNLTILWDDAPILKQGEVWRLPVRLSRIVGRANQAGFDAEQYAVSQNIHGRAVVVESNIIPIKLSSHISLRQQWLDKVTVLLENATHQRYLVALAFGLRDGLGAQDWVYLRDSGLAHLLAISGLHIGLAMLMGWWIGFVIRLCLPQAKRWRWLPLIFGLSFAFIYTWLAGFSVPTVRALIMCLLVGSLRIYGIFWLNWQILLVTLGISLLVDPLASYGASFWLSFCAIAIFIVIFITDHRVFDQSASWFSRLQQKLVDLIKVQIFLLLLMLPIQWWWFGGTSLVAPLTNIFAVPWLSLITIPNVLLGVITVFVPMISSFFWSIADLSLVPVMYLFKWSEGAWLLLPVYMAPILLMLAIGFLCWQFLPLFYFKWLYLSFVFLVISWRWSDVIDTDVDDAWKIMMLDVGHGLAILIEKAGHVLVYDTGNTWNDNSIAQTVITPILAQKGISIIDSLMLSHADSDHASGTDYLIDKYKPITKYSSDNRHGFLPCIAGQQWQWQGLDFVVKWPPKKVETAANANSCVIHIQASTGQGISVLLTGDIDAKSELLMLMSSNQWQADIVVVPHHGSKTSSTHTLLETLQPSLALVSVAYFNAWSLPAPSIKQRYQDKGIRWLSTSNRGQLTVNIQAERYDVIQHRQDRMQAWFRPYWLIDNE